MKSETPSFAIIKALKKAGFVAPADRAWYQVDIPVDGQAFVKYECECLKNIKAECDKSKKESKTKSALDDLNLEVILKSYGYSEKDKRYVYYIGQCFRCQKIYWTTP